MSRPEQGVTRQTLRRLLEMTADELTKALKDHFDSIGGLATATDLAIGRELVRRERDLERLKARQGGVRDN
jgi:hypothetical protein